MTTSTTVQSRIRAIGAAILSVLLLVALTACGDSEQGPGAASSTSAAPNVPGGGSLEPSLAPDAVAACKQVFSQPAPDDAEQVLVVKDPTASVAAMPLPGKLIDDIKDVSKNGGVLTVIAVDGPDAQPRIVAKRVALSTPGDRTRPSVAKLAEVMPHCVQQVLLDPIRPTKPDTDLYRAMSLARDLTRGKTRLWTLTDLVANAGQLNLAKGELLQMTPAAAAKSLGRSAPLDLGGQPWHLSGVANTTAKIAPASRAWMQDFAKALCTTWHASGCDAVPNDPVNPDRPDAAKLPKDAALPFPGLEDNGRCSFSLPSGIAFADESDDLRPEAADLLAKPVALLKQNPAATAKVIGHTASISAKPGTGIGLSRRRAQAVKKALVAAGIDAARIKADGVGDTQPLAEDFDAATGRQIEAKAARERRVTIMLKGVPCSG